MHFYQLNCVVSDGNTRERKYLATKSEINVPYVQ